MRHIKQDLPLSQRPRIIYLSGHAQNQMLKETAQGNLLDVLLNKPVTASRLYDSLMMSQAGQGNLVEIHPEANLAADLGGVRVLLVEDNEINQQLASALLNRVATKVSIAADGVEALKLLEQKTFDVVLMDMQMPNMDGLEATRRIRKIAALGGLPIIAMTANAMFGDRERCLEAGMNDYISKPIHAETMYAAIARWTGRDGGALLAEAEKQPVSQLIPVLDTGKAIANMGSEDIYLIVLEKFISNQGKAAQTIADALAANDSKAAARLVHTLKGLAATIGAGKLSELVHQMEQAIHSADSLLCGQLLATVEAEFVRVIAEVDVYLKTHEAVSHTETAAPEAEEIKRRMTQLAEQLQNFDSSASATMRQIIQMLRGSGHEQHFMQLARFIDAYDYENAQLELQRLGKQFQ